MACWKDDMVVMLRTRIDDLGDTPNYSDTRLQQMLVVAARDVVREIDFDTDYTINIGVPDFSPDPSSSGDYDFENLVTLKAACILARGVHKSKAMQALLIKDGPANVDGRGLASAIKEWCDSLCKEYENASLSFRAGSRLVGRAIIGPYRFNDGGCNTQTFN